MSHSDPRSVVRAAIALVALNHKPIDQSTASYLLDLQSRFPVATKHNDSRHWRTYALELEKQLATLKAQRDADQELLSKLPTDASQAAASSDAPPPKKKSKKNPTKDQHDPEWSWDQSHADWSHFLSSQYPSSPSLVVAYAALKGVLAAPNADLLSYASRLSDAILRALDTIHHFLFSPPNSSPVAHTQTALGAPSQLKPEHIGSTRIALASPLLMYTLRTGLHALVLTAQDTTKSKRLRQRAHATTTATVDAHAHVDKVCDRLLERVLLPLLRAIVPLCHARLAPLVSVSLKKDRDKVGRAAGKGKGKDKDKRSASSSVDPPKKTDVRTDVFALIGTSLEALDALPPLIRPDPDATAGKSAADGGSIAAGLRDRLGLETIRELEALYLVPPTVASSASSNSLQPLSQQLPAPPSLSTSTPAPTPTPTPTPTHPRPHPQSQPQSQPRARRTVPESRTKRLEKLAGTRADRVRALATRDAGWLLASTLNLCVTPPAGRTDGSGGLLREALLDRIGKLVRSAHVPFGILVSEGPGQESSNASEARDERAAADRNATDAKFTIDPVCQNMLLAICERAMSNLVSC